MELINWPAVARNALWLLGLSVALAAWSHSSWWAAVQRQPFRQALDRPAFSIPFSAGLLLFSTSLAWGATRGWERLLWVGLALWFAWELVAGARRTGAQPRNHSAITPW